MSKKVTGKAFDAKIFKRLIGFAKKYKVQFIIGTFSAILLSLFSIARPILLQEIVNTYFENKDKEGLLYFSLLLCLFLLYTYTTIYTTIYDCQWLRGELIDFLL